MQQSSAEIGSAANTFTPAATNAWSHSNTAHTRVKDSVAKRDGTPKTAFQLEQYCRNQRCSGNKSSEAGLDIFPLGHCTPNPEIQLPPSCEHQPPLFQSSLTQCFLKKAPNRRTHTFQMPGPGHRCPCRGNRWPRAELNHHAGISEIALYCSTKNNTYGPSFPASRCFVPASEPRLSRQPLRSGTGRLR